VSETLAELQRLVRERLGLEHTLRAETDLVADLALDSVQQLDLIVALENHFAVALDVEGDEGVRTVGELVDWIDRARRGAR
jgi:acyl carrier protein